MKKLAEKIRRVGIVANPEKTAGRAAVREAVKLITASGREVITEPATARMAGLSVPVVADTAALAAASELVMVFGGDGTMLRVAREIGGARTPVLGINIGGLGFLTAVSTHDLAAALQHVWAGEFSVEARPLIAATGRVAGGVLRQTACNDFVISRGAIPRLIELEVTVDGAMLTRFRCDGLIISTPTGSTAYSLSAGGAIVSPDAAVLTITPICPHTLSNRSVVVNLDATIEVRVASEKLEAMLSADGDCHTRLAPGEVIRIRRSRASVRLVHLAGSSFFETLRRKLNWSGSNLNGNASGT